MLPIITCYAYQLLNTVCPICLQMTSQHNTMRSANSFKAGSSSACTWQTHILIFHWLFDIPTIGEKNLNSQQQTFSCRPDLLTITIGKIFSFFFPVPAHFSRRLKYGYRDTVRLYLTSLNWEHPLIVYTRSNGDHLTSTLFISLMFIPTIKSYLWEHLLAVKQIYQWAL